MYLKQQQIVRLQWFKCKSDVYIYNRILLLDVLCELYVSHVAFMKAACWEYNCKYLLHSWRHKHCHVDALSLGIL